MAMLVITRGYNNGRWINIKDQHRSESRRLPLHSPPRLGGYGSGWIENSSNLQVGVSENVVYPEKPNGFADHYPY